MIQIVQLNRFNAEQLLEVRDVLESEGGQILVEMMNTGLNLYREKVMRTEEGAERNRGRADVYAGFMQLDSQIRDDLAERRMKKSKISD